MELKPIITGILSCVPGVTRYRAGHQGGETQSGRYCYSVWLRHLISAWNSGAKIRPATVAELGPGNSIGAGLAALLSGAERYYGFDVVNYVNSRCNLDVLDELAELFRARADLPGPDEFPNCYPLLQDYRFPGHILTDDLLNDTLADDRLARIRACIAGEPGAEPFATYKAPWDSAEVMRPGSVDMIFSQAVLEHVTRPQATYEAMRKWLRPGGLVSHAIDFKSHAIVAEWNGHWTYPEWIWTVVEGRRPYLINRCTCSDHLAFLREAGFRVITEQRTTRDSKLQLSDLAGRFRRIDPKDLTTDGVFVQAVLPATSDGN